MDNMSGAFDSYYSWSMSTGDIADFAYAGPSAGGGYVKDGKYTTDEGSEYYVMDGRSYILDKNYDDDAGFSKYISVDDILDVNDKSQSASYRATAQDIADDFEDRVTEANDRPGFWQNIGTGFSQFGDKWADMFKSGYRALTPNVFRLGTGNANGGEGAPPPRPGRTSIWVDWDLMTLLMVGFDKKPLSAKSAKDMTTDKSDIESIEQFSPSNTDREGTFTHDVHYWELPSGGYDSTWMHVNGIWISSGIPRRN